MLWIRFRHIFAMMFIILICVGCGRKEGTNEDNAERLMLPKFSADASNGEHYSHKQFFDGVGVMSFVASWCGPCGAELVELDSLARKYSKLLALAVTYEPPEFYDALIESLKIDVPIVRVDSTFFISLNVSRLPTRFLIDKGKIIFCVTGAPLPSDGKFDACLKNALGIEEENGIEQDADISDSGKEK